MIAILFISFIILLALGIPVAFCLGLSSLIYFIGSGMPLVMFSQRFFAGMDSFTLLCIPGFFLAGSLMNIGGITDRLILFCKKMVGHVTGGLSLANIVASMIFAGMSGTALADTVSLGGVLIPAMEKDGYDTDYACAVTCASSCVGPIIPPSVPMIVAATLTSLSVGKLFVAGIIPGILLGVGMMIVSVIISHRRQYPKEPRAATLKEILISGRDSFWAILMTIIILGGIIGGIVTPTEASIIAVIYAIFVGFFVYRELTMKTFLACLEKTAYSSAAIMVLVGFANIFAYILTKEQIPQLIATWMLSITKNKIIILFLINILLIIVGMFMETIAAIVILFPVLLGVVTAVGVSPIQFGIIAVLNLVLGLTTPPVGVCMFAATSIGKIPLQGVIRQLLPFLAVNFFVLLLVTYCPAITVGVANLLIK